MKVTKADKLIVLLNCTVPVALLGYDAYNHNLGADPVNFAIHTTGLLALFFLTLSLTITPISKLTGASWLVNYRRLHGHYAFFHACLHFGIFFWWDRGGSISSTLNDIFSKKNYFLWFGTASLVLMIPLAATSTDAMIRRLGPKRWKALHRLAYLAASAGATHYYLVGKVTTNQAKVFAVVVGALLLFRVIAARFHRKRMGTQVRSAPVSSGAIPQAGPTSVKPKFWTGQLRVAHIFHETPDVRTFRLSPLEGHELPFTYLPGQYLNLSLMIDGKKVNRSYTMASTPTRTSYCEITIKRDGLASRHMHDQIRVGDTLQISAPAGKFTFIGTEAPSIVMIAGGVGITPLMAKIRYLTDICWNGDTFLLHATRTERDLIFCDELRYLEQRHPNLHVTVTLTREENPAWNGLRGRLTPELLTKLVPALKQSAIHICGPTAMAEETRKMLCGLGVSDDQIKDEAFTSPNRAGVEMPAATLASVESQAPATSAPASSNGLSVTFARSNQSADVSKDQTILEAAESIGVPIDYDCRAGICGTCKTKLLSGKVAMETQDALNDEDRAQNLILCCQARCLEPVTIDA